VPKKRHHGVGRRPKKRYLAHRHPRKKRPNPTAAPYKPPSLWSEPLIQHGFLRAALHLLNTFAPGTMAAFDEAIGKPLVSPQGIDPANVRTLHKNDQGEYE
jgi:hypothetical protein